MTLLQKTAPNYLGNNINLTASSNEFDYIHCGREWKTVD